MNHLAPTVFQVFALLFSWWRLERRLAVFDVKFLINAYCRLYISLVSHRGANSQEGVGGGERGRGDVLVVTLDTRLGCRFFSAMI